MLKRVFLQITLLVSLLSVAGCTYEPGKKGIIRNKEEIQRLNNFECFWEDMDPGENRCNCYKSLFTGKDYYFNGDYDLMGSKIHFKTISVDIDEKENEEKYVLFIPNDVKAKCLNLIKNNKEFNYYLDRLLISYTSYIEGTLFCAAKKLNLLNKCRWYCFNNEIQMQDYMASFSNNIGIILSTKKVLVLNDLETNEEVNKEVLLYVRKVYRIDSLTLNKKLYEEPIGEFYHTEYYLFSLSGHFLMTCDKDEQFNKDYIYAPSYFTYGYIPYTIKRNDSINKYRLENNVRDYVKKDYEDLYLKYSVDQKVDFEEDELVSLIKEIYERG